MKNKTINITGKIIIALGVLSLFRTAKAFYGFDGYVDNTWEIIITSAVLIVIGVILLVISKKSLSK